MNKLNKFDRERKKESKKIKRDKTIYSTKYARNLEYAKIITKFNVT
jgi:hypothetical protein